MGACGKCGGGINDTDRFCRSCGTATDIAACDSFELFGIAPQGTSTTAEATTDNRNKLLAMGGAFVVALLAWALMRSPAGDDLGQNSILEDGQAAEEDRTTTTGRTTSTRRIATTISNLSRLETTMLGDGGPLLGRETGWDLFIGSDNSEMVRINLDTGEVTETENRLLPLYSHDGWLLASNPNSGALRRLRLDDLAADPERFGISGPMIGPVGSLPSGPEPGQVWVMSGDYETPVWQLTEISDASVVREVEGGVFFGPSTQGPQVAGSPSGGVFALRGDNYERVADGAPIAVSDPFVLVQRCTAPNACELGWLDRQTWQPVERALPDVQLHWAALSDNGRVLAYFSRFETGLFDVERGITLSAEQGNPEGFALSPDGRYLVLVGGATRILDLDTDETIALPGLQSNGYARALFVERGDG